jgi:uncharacterized protein with ParB-like and HNH nuclease domain
LDYRSRQIGIRNQNLMQFIRQLAAGEFLIPTFQRLFVWSAENIIDLWDSIYHCYPIGSILCWRTRSKLHVHRKIGGFFIPEHSDPCNSLQSYILDGQQRATSLVASFYGGTGKIKDRFSLDYTLYCDLITSAFFFEKDYYKHRWDADQAFLLKLKDVPDLPANYCDGLVSLPGFSLAVEKNLEQLRYMFSDYSIPIVNLEGFDIADVCAIYERINQTGTRLKNMDILIARGFKNYATVVEEDFPITEPI